MNVIILAAGYATRLYPLTLNQAKPLLRVAGKPMIEWIIGNLASVPDIEKVYIVTNNKFVASFEAWSREYSQKQPQLRFKIVNDGTLSDDDRRGAIGDIHFVLHTQNLQQSDLLVVAGDNLFSQPIDGFANFAKNYPATLGLYDVRDLEAIKKYNSVATDSQGRVIHFEEKSQHPTSTRTGIALYYYRKDVIPLIDMYVREGNNLDQPGRLIQWLHPRVEVQTWPVPGTWFDIGSKESLEEADHIFSQLANASP
jgi:glucose-1-phosphate thymidylyltransferase